MTDPGHAIIAQGRTGRAVVTGGAGFIGRAFVQRLKADGWDVAAVDVRPGPQVVSGDITRRGGWTDLLDGADLLVHAAGLSGDSGDHRAHTDVNVGGARMVMESCHHAGVGRVLHVSTAAVLGRGFPDGATESRAIAMTGNPYIDSKVAAEHQVLMQAARGLPVTIIRPIHVYGPHSPQWTMRLVQLISRGMFMLAGGAEGIVSPTYITDVVEGGLRAATSPAGVGEVFHITGGVGIPVTDFVSHYATMVDRTLPSWPRAAAGALTLGAEKVLPALGMAPPFSSRAMDLLSLPGTFAVDKAERLLGWHPRVSLEAGMVATEAWLRDVGLIARV